MAETVWKWWTDDYDLFAGLWAESRGVTYQITRSIWSFLARRLARAKHLNKNKGIDEARVEIECTERIPRRVACCWSPLVLWQ